MKIFVNELKEGEFIKDQVFSIEEIQQHKTRTQAPYYRIVLQDKSGEIAAKIWQDDFPNCHLRGVESGDVIKIDGQVSTYKGKKQITIKKLDKTEDYEISDLIQSSTKDLEGMYESIIKHIEKVKNSHLKELLENIIKDEKLAKLYKRSPAAEKVHHDYIGGLMEHTLEMLDLGITLIKSYPKADSDMVIAGIILHDIGKIYELSVNNTAIQRTVEGKLIGHLILGIELIIEHLPEDFPSDLWLKLEHIVISHQGEPAFGSPVRPATIEAAIVHFADLSSSQVRQFQKAINLGEGYEKGFSDYQKWIETKVYLE